MADFPATVTGTKTLLKIIAPCCAVACAFCLAITFTAPSNRYLTNDQRRAVRGQTDSDPVHLLHAIELGIVVGIGAGALITALMPWPGNARKRSLNESRPGL